MMNLIVLNPVDDILFSTYVVENSMEASFIAINDLCSFTPVAV